MAVVGVGFIAGVIVARHFGPSGRGELVAVQAFALTLASVAHLGIPDACVFVVSRQGGESAASAIWTAAALVGSAALGLAGIYWALVPLLLSQYGDAVVAVARDYAVVIPLLALTAVTTSSLRSRDRYRTWNLLRLLPALTWLASVLAGTYVGLGVVELARLFLIGRVAGAVLEVVVGLHGLGGGRVQPSLGRSLLRYGLPAAGASLPSTVTARLDQVMMAVVASSTATGVYTVANSWSLAPVSIVAGSAGVLLPAIAGDGAEQQGDVAGTVSRFGLYAGILIAVLSALAAPIAIPAIYGPQFVDSIAPAIVLSLGAGALISQKVVSEVAKGSGRPKVLLASELSGAITTVGLLTLLVPQFGIWGAVFGSVLSYAVSLVAILGPLFHANVIGRSSFSPRRGDLRLIVSVISSRRVR